MTNKIKPGLTAGMKLLLAGALAVTGPAAQAAPDSAASFEAASVKALKERQGATHFAVLPNRLDVKNLSLQFLIKQAYDLRDDQVSGPDWMIDHGYDIVANSGAPVSQAAMLSMLKYLLIERFRLVTHWETRTKATYRLTTAPNGPKMRVAEQGYAMPNSPMQMGNTRRLFGPMSMRQLAERLTPFAKKPVVDGTGLGGYFTIALDFASDDLDSKADNGPPAAPLTAAVWEQLGLKLVPESGPIRILVIDHAEQVPTAN